MVMGPIEPPLKPVLPLWERVWKLLSELVTVLRPADLRAVFMSECVILINDYRVNLTKKAQGPKIIGHFPWGQHGVLV